MHAEDTDPFMYATACHVCHFKLSSRIAHQYKPSVGSQNEAASRRASMMRAQSFFPLLLAASMVCFLAPVASRMTFDYRKASSDPPVSKPPQFILFS